MTKSVAQRGIPEAKRWTAARWHTKGGSRRRQNSGRLRGGGGRAAAGNSRRLRGGRRRAVASAGETVDGCEVAEAWR